MKPIERPLDLLNEMRNKPVIASLNTGIQVSGILLAFDIHINVVIDNATLVDQHGETKKIGRQFIRGDCINYIC